MNSVEEALRLERENVDFKPELLSQFLYGKEFYARLKKVLDERSPFPFDMNMFNKGRLAIIKETTKIAGLFYDYSTNTMSDDVEALYLFINCLNQMPGSIHNSMFVRCLDIMGSDEQIEQFKKKSINYQIMGCYAQTQLGHGSDVSSLLTTATLDEKTDQFIINTPCLQATKFWPGDLGLYATHALVFANLITNGKSRGIQSFLVPIRDPKTMKPLKGIDVGDIGPKIGFPAKDNGYLSIDNVRIPRKHMLSRFIEVKRDGQIVIKGNPKIVYAAMMEVRKHLCTTCPKIYFAAITIAGRYSMFRRQFKNSAQQEIKIMDYQLQQQKIISRIAEFYAITRAGNSINKICEENIKNVMQKEDFSLMNEAHLCLSLGKPLIGEIVYDGMEICRKACGGHGFSMYSGFPFLINEYAANLTIEGENTVLYLQVAKYLLKKYRKSMDPNKKVPESLIYLKDFQTLLQRKCTIQQATGWTLEDIRILLAQSICHLLRVVTQKMLNKSQQVSHTDVWNYEAGIRLKQLAKHHSIHYIYQSFKKSVEAENSLKIKEHLTNLCLLFGINMLTTNSGSIIQSGLITSQQLVSLLERKQIILKKLRPVAIGLIDGFGIPDKYIRSALIRGNPYQNMLKLARQNPINHQRLQSVNVTKTVKNHIHNPDPSL